MTSPCCAQGTQPKFNYLSTISKTHPSTLASAAASANNPGAYNIYFEVLVSLELRFWLVGVGRGGGFMRHDLAWSLDHFSY